MVVTRKKSSIKTERGCGTTKGFPYSGITSKGNVDIRGETNRGNLGESEANVCQGEGVSKVNPISKISSNTNVAKAREKQVLMTQRVECSMDICQETLSSGKLAVGKVLEGSRSKIS